MLSHIDVTKRQKDDKILIETETFVYELTVIDPEKSIITIEGGHRFKKIKNAIVLGSTQGGPIVKPGQIHYGMKLRVRIGTGPGSYQLDLSNVLSAKIYNDDWSFELDWGHMEEGIEEEDDEAPEKKRRKK